MKMGEGAMGKKGSISEAPRQPWDFLFQDKLLGILTSLVSTRYIASNIIPFYTTITDQIQLYHVCDTPVAELYNNYLLIYGILKYFIYIIMGKATNSLSFSTPPPPPPPPPPFPLRYKGEKKEFFFFFFFF